MRAILKIFWFYLNFQRLMTLTVFAGLFIAFIITPVVAYKAGAQEVSATLLLVYVLIFLFAFIASPWAFRLLISNQRLSLVPNLNLSAGIALFLLMLVSIAIPVLTTHFVMPLDDDAIPLLYILNMFSLASFYIAIVQLAPTFRWLGIIMIYVPMLLFLTLQFFSDLLLKVLIYPPFIVTFFFFSLVGWVYGFYILSTQSHFKSLSLYTSQWADWSHNKKSIGDFSWFGIFTLKGTHSKVDSILFGFLDGPSSKISRCVLMAVLVPVFWALVIIVIGIPEGDNTQMNLWQVFLYGNLCMIAISGATNGELPARARFLWLRTTGDRAVLWRYIDRAILKVLMIYLCISLLLCMLFLSFSPLPFSLIANYPILSVCCYFYASYLVVAGRVNCWSGFVTLLIFSITFGVLIAAFVNASSNSLYYNALEVFLIIAGLLLRYYAKCNFTHINWLEVKPLIRSRLTAQFQPG